MTTAAYVRITATDTQLGVTRQLDEILQLCDQRKLHDVVVYEDNDESASNSDNERPAYLRLLDDIRSGVVKHVVVWHADRLYRRFDDLKIIVDVVEASHCKISTVKSGEIDLTTPSGRMIARMLGAAAAYEIEHARERMISQKRQRALDGKPQTGGRRPLGYDKISVDGDVQLVINPLEAAAIRDAVTTLLSGGSQRQAARRMSEQLGRTMLPSNMRQALARPSLAGLSTYSEPAPLSESSKRTRRKLRSKPAVVAKGNWDAIITEEQHVALVALFADNSVRMSRPSTGRVYLGSSLFTCSTCKGTIRSSGARNSQARYMCEKGCCSRHVAHVDEYTRRVIAGYLAQPSIVAAFANLESVDLAPLIAERAATNERLAQLAAAVANGIMTIEAVTRGSLEARARVAQIDAEISRATSSCDEAAAVFTAENPVDAFLTGDLDTQRAVISKLVVVRMLPATKGRPKGWKLGQPYFDKSCVDFVPSEQLAQLLEGAAAAS